MSSKLDSMRTDLKDGDEKLKQEKFNFTLKDPFLVLIDTNIYARPLEPRRFIKQKVHDKAPGSAEEAKQTKERVKKKKEKDLSPDQQVIAEKQRQKALREKQKQAYSNGSNGVPRVEDEKLKVAAREAALANQRKCQETEFDKLVYLDILECGLFRELITEASVVECAGAKYDEYSGSDMAKAAHAQKALECVLQLKDKARASHPLSFSLQKSCQHLSRLKMERTHQKEYSPLTAKDLFELFNSVTAEDIIADSKARPDLWKGKIAANKLEKQDEAKIRKELQAAKAQLKTLNIGKLGLGDLMYLFNAMLYDAPIITENSDMIRQIENSQNIIVRYLFSPVTIIVPVHNGGKEKDATGYRKRLSNVMDEVAQHYGDAAKLKRKAGLDCFKAKIESIRNKAGNSGNKKESKTDDVASVEPSRGSSGIMSGGSNGIVNAVSKGVQNGISNGATKRGSLLVHYLQRNRVSVESAPSDGLADLKSKLETVATKADLATVNHEEERSEMLNKLMTFSLSLPDLAKPTLNRSHSERMEQPAMLRLVRLRSS